MGKKKKQKVDESSDFTPSSRSVNISTKPILSDVYDKNKERSITLTTHSEQYDLYC